MRKTFDVSTAEGDSYKARIRKGRLILDDQKYSPERASLDGRRKNPIWVIVVYIVTILLVSVFAAAVIGEPIISGVVFMAGVAISFLVFMIMSRMEEVLLVDHEKGRLELFGEEDDLHGLYYMLSKETIPKLRSKTADIHDDRGSAKERPGVDKGESLVGKDEARYIREDLEKRVGKRRRMVTQVCPECGSTELYYETGLMGGYKYHCKECDYVGAFVIEKELDFDDEGPRKEKSKGLPDRER